jgi:hypothetical protein
MAAGQDQDQEGEDVEGVGGCTRPDRADSRSSQRRTGRGCVEGGGNLVEAPLQLSSCLHAHPMAVRWRNR